jgi:hypothetical protein
VVISIWPLVILVAICSTCKNQPEPQHNQLSSVTLPLQKGTPLPLPHRPHTPQRFVCILCWLAPPPSPRQNDGCPFPTIPSTEPLMPQTRPSGATHNPCASTAPNTITHLEEGGLSGVAARGAGGHDHVGGRDTTRAGGGRHTVAAR